VSSLPLCPPSAVVPLCSEVHELSFSTVTRKAVFRRSPGLERSHTDADPKLDWLNGAQLMTRGDYLALAHIANAAVAFWTWQASPPSQRGTMATLHTAVAVSIELLRARQDWRVG